MRRDAARQVGGFCLLWTLLVRAISSQAETGYDAWLRYARMDDAQARRCYEGLPAVTVALGDSEVVKAAQAELVRGIRAMLGRTLRMEAAPPGESAFLLGTLGAVKKVAPGFQAPADLKEDGFCLKTVIVDGHRDFVIAALNERGVLYGAFALLRKLALHETLDSLHEQDMPYAPVRMVNQWDNPDGSIEREYAGKSFFWEDGHIAKDLTRARDFARLLASLGINGCSINNVNADARALEPGRLPEIARVADAFRPWGVRVFVCIDFSSPAKIGNLDTFDPLDARVADFWKRKADEIYRAIPDFGGFVVKADSEGRAGPSVYGRTHADAANVLARALHPHGGLLFYRGFVYNHHADWRNWKNDRARAAYENFHHLDGAFDDNVIVQIKNGPIDFQVREPASPLLGALEKTSQAIELQITQEYTGQQRHLCYLAPLWKEALGFDMQANGPGTPVKALVAGKTFHRALGGFVGVSNAGRDTNWLGSDLAMANLYAFGRLAWNPDLSSRSIAREWTQLTFGEDPEVLETITDMELGSWRVYEDYTGPLGVGGLTDIIGVHYGPGIESSERNGWGQWHRADEKGIGMDRTVSTGTGFIGQYRPLVAQGYESLESCPDSVLLFFHHVPYTYELHSGKTVIQHIYDTHYAGAAAARDCVRRWKSLKGRIDGDRYQRVLARLEYQAGHAIVWRDAICQWFLKTSGIPDASGRAGHYPNRVEAEGMKLDGYEIMDVHPWETASGGKAVRCVGPDGRGSVSFQYRGRPGWFDLAVQYFDQIDGVSQFSLSVAGQRVDRWLADDTLPSDAPNGHTSTRRTIAGIALRPGDEIRIDAVAGGGEKACIDYVEIDPAQE